MGCLYRRKKKLPDGTRVETGPFWIKYYRNGTPFCESTHTERKSKADKELKRREGDIAKGVPITSRVGRVLFDELIENLLTEYEVNRRSSLSTLRIRCKKHLLPVFAGRRASTITSAEVDRFILDRQKGEASPEEIKQELDMIERDYVMAIQRTKGKTEISRSEIRKELKELKRQYSLELRQVHKKAGASNAEINRELAAMKRAFSLAVRSGLLLTKPYIPTLNEDNTRKGFFEKEQFEAVYQFLPEHVRPVAAIAYITGWRTKSELLPMEWRQVDFNAGILGLEPGTTKNKEGRVFPFTHEVRSILSEQKAKTEALQKTKGMLIPWVFHQDGKSFKSYRRAWKTACRKAGVPGMIPHDFRRTAVRNLIRAGISEGVAMKMTGHKTRAVFERYNIVSQGDLIDAARRLDNFSVTFTVTAAQKPVQ